MSGLIFLNDLPAPEPPMTISLRFAAKSESRVKYVSFASGIPFAPCCNSSISYFISTTLSLNLTDFIDGIAGV